MRRSSWPTRTRLGLAAVVVLAAACGTPDQSGRNVPENEGISVVDATGRRLTLPRPATRIVSLVPSVTETLRVLGAADAVVGRTDHDEGAWVARVPSVGGGIEPNLEAIVALRPDLVVRFAGTQDPRTPRRLDDLGIHHIAVRPDALDDIYETIDLLGRVTATDSAADSLTHAIRAGLHAAEQRAAELPRVRFAYVLGGTPPWVSGPGTYIDDVLSLVGGDNAFADLDVLYSAVSAEELITRDIDVVLVPSPGTYDQSLTPQARVEVVGDLLEIPGPDIVQAADSVAELLHGQTSS